MYVEGSGYQMGYLVGLLAEREVRLMAKEYVRHVIPEFISPDLDSDRKNRLIELLLWVVREYCHAVYAVFPDDIPAHLRDEMRGMADGCKAKDSTSTVTYDELLSLNAGIDCLVSAIYSGLGLTGAITDHIPGRKGDTILNSNRPRRGASAGICLRRWLRRPTRKERKLAGECLRRSSASTARSVPTAGEPG